MRETYSCYDFEISGHIEKDMPGKNLYVYKIFGTGCPPYDDGVIDSDEWFETENEARFAAIGRIGLLENGE